MKVQVTINNVKIIEPSILNENEYNIHNCEFEFTEEYNGLTKKAVFTNQANETYVETIVDDKCSIPTEVLKEKEHIKIGVYAYDVDNEELLLRYSPRPTEFYVHEGSYKEGQNSTPPTPSEIEQLQAQITENANDIDGIIDDIVDIEQDITDIKAEQITQNEYIQANSNNIVDINGQIVDINQDIQDLEANKADKTEIPTKTSDLINDSDFVSDANYVHTDNNFTNEDEAQITQNKNDISTLQNTKADKSEIPTKTSDLTNDSGFINKNVNDLVNYTLKTNTGSLIDLEINGTTYVVTLNLKDVDGNVISTDTIDLPLESVVVGGSYDAVNKKIVLTLENGNTVDIPVGDLIAGLQTEITSQNKLASDLVDDTNSGNKFVTTSEKQAWNAKYDKPVGGIPSTDLSSGVQASLDKADTAIQEDDLADYVKNTDYATSSKGGVVKPYNYLQVNSNGQVYADTVTYQSYQNVSNQTFIGKGTLENVITGKELINQTKLEESQAIQDTEIEALQNKVEELETDNENLRKALPQIKGEGTDFTLENTSNNKFVELGLNGNTEQKQLEGKNLFNVVDIESKYPATLSTETINNILDITANTTVGAQYITYIVKNLDNTKNYTISFKAKKVVKGTSGNPILRCTLAGSVDETTFTSISNVDQSNPTQGQEYSLFYVLTGYNTYRFRFYNNPGTPVTEGEKTQYYEIQLEEGSTATSYEPYCGGIPSPNPGYPQQIKNVTGNSNVKIQNRNLFDYQFASDYSNTTVSSYRFAKIADVKKGQQYNINNLDISDIQGESGLYVYIVSKPDYDGVIYGNALCSNSNKLSQSSKILNNPTSNNYYIGIYPSNINETTYNKILDKFKNAQLEQGTTATSYVPHEEQNLPFTFAEGQRAMQGTALDDDGIHNTRTQLNLKDKNWVIRQDYTDTDYVLFKQNDYETDIYKSIANCTHFPITSSTPSPAYNCIRLVKTAGYGINILIQKSIASTPEELKTWLTAQNVIVEIELEQPEIIPYQGVQQSQYNAIKKARSYADKTYITSTSDELGFDMNVVAVADANKVIDSELQEIKSAVIALGGDLNV